LKAYILKHI